MTEEQIAAANAKFDKENGLPAEFQDNPFRFNRRGFNPGWNEHRLLAGKKLSDRKIKQYEKKGFYGNEIKEFRKQMAERKKNRDL